MKPMTRRERRAERQRQYLMKRSTPPASPDCQASDESGAIRPWDGESPLPWWLRPLDYRVSGESGALRIRGKGRTWHQGGRANGHAPPPGQGWERSGPTYVVKVPGLGILEKPMTHSEWRRMVAEPTTANTDG
ncbi:MAG: hypothetical protein HYU30_05590 [Chloroflexi bacterium]|nr:hypothetical protein [Chloroflexota bacterium]